MAQLIDSPTTFHIQPMQIDTKNRHYNGSDFRCRHFLSLILLHHMQAGPAPQDLGRPSQRLLLRSAGVSLY